MIDDQSSRADAPEPDAEAHVSRALPTREYRADRITVQWYAKRCIHSGNCVRALPRVFDFQRRPWVDVAAADAEAIAHAVRRCPSGALRYVWHDPEASEPSDGVARAVGPSERRDADA